ncbi:MAG: hypothetical protein AAB847_00215 [Patescibacteria group bacterium]
MRNGQVMLLAVLVISGTILGATTVAGMLMLNQLRQATNIGLSMQAIFAADTGIEWELFKLFKPEDATANSGLEPIMENKTCVLTELDGLKIKSVGCAGGDPTLVCKPDVCPRPITRAFEVFLAPIDN